jgi:DUF971 family protein
MSEPHHEPIPTEIQLHQGHRELELHFDDGSEFRLPCEYLRVFSPSAEAEMARERGNLVVGKEKVNITAINPVGSYAVQLVFDDAHDTGVYSWELLYDLGKNFRENWNGYLAALKDKGIVRKGGID